MSKGDIQNIAKLSPEVMKILFTFDEIEILNSAESELNRQEQAIRKLILTYTNSGSKSAYDRLIEYSNIAGAEGIEGLTTEVSAEFISKWKNETIVKRMLRLDEVLTENFFSKDAQTGENRDPVKDFYVKLGGMLMDAAQVATSNTADSSTNMPTLDAGNKGEVSKKSPSLLGNLTKWGKNFISRKNKTSSVGISDQKESNQSANEGNVENNGSDSIQNEPKNAASGPVNVAPPTMVANYYSTGKAAPKARNSSNLSGVSPSIAQQPTTNAAAESDPSTTSSAQNTAKGKKKVTISDPALTTATVESESFFSGVSPNTAQQPTTNAAAESDPSTTSSAQNNAKGKAKVIIPTLIIPSLSSVTNTQENRSTFSLDLGEQAEITQSESRPKREVVLSRDDGSQVQFTQREAKISQEVINAAVASENDQDQRPKEIRARDAIIDATITIAALERGLSNVQVANILEYAIEHNGFSRIYKGKGSDIADEQNAYAQAEAFGNSLGNNTSGKPITVKEMVNFSSRIQALNREAGVMKEDGRNGVSSSDVDISVVNNIRQEGFLNEDEARGLFARAQAVAPSGVTHTNSNSATRLFGTSQDQGESI